MSRAREIADRDLAATELILDADNDTSITADTDDQIDIRVGGTDTVVVTPDVLEVKGSHPDLKLLDSDDNNYGGLFYSDGTLTLGSDHGGQHSSSKARISVDGTARVTIDDGGDVDIETGDIFFSTAGKGINLGVTSNTDSNTLHDYEEGTWSAVLTGASSGTFNGVGEFYIKIGRLVYITSSFSAVGTGLSGAITITGLPFVSSNVSSLTSYFSIPTHNVDINGIGMLCYLATNVSYVHLYNEVDDAGYDTTQGTDFDGNTYFKCIFSYVVDD